MELSNLRDMYDHEGPFATVYLEGRSPGEDAHEQMRLRWKALREQLGSSGATDDAIDAIETRLLRDAVGEEQANGRVLVATDSGVLLDEPWDAALGNGDDAHWTILPELAAYVREKARAIRELVVIADQQGAQIRQEVIAEQHEPREVEAEEIEGGAVEGVHKPRGGALSHNQIQRRADEAVSQNAKDIVAHLDTVASNFHPWVVVLAGEVQARTAIRDELSKELNDMLVETDRGGRDSNASDEALTDDLLRIAAHESQRRADNTADRWQESQAHDRGVHGSEEVAKAAEMGAVDTLLLEEGTTADREAFLLKTCAETSSAATVVPQGTGLSDGVGAILRFPLES